MALNISSIRRPNHIIISAKSPTKKQTPPVYSPIDALRAYEKSTLAARTSKELTQELEKVKALVAKTEKKALEMIETATELAKDNNPENLTSIKSHLERAGGYFDARSFRHLT